MITVTVIEDRCCDCAVSAYPCLGSRCELRHVEVHYCDMCGSELWDDAVWNGAYELCAVCADERTSK